LDNRVRVTPASRELFRTEDFVNLADSRLRRSLEWCPTFDELCRRIEGFGPRDGGGALCATCGRRCRSSRSRRYTSPICNSPSRTWDFCCEAERGGRCRCSDQGSGVVCVARSGIVRHSVGAASMTDEPQRRLAVLLGSAASMAVIISSAGMSTLVTYVTARRRREDCVADSCVRGGSPPRREAIRF